jgi:hypothetical protein
MRTIVWMGMLAFSAHMSALADPKIPDGIPSRTDQEQQNGVQEQRNGVLSPMSPTAAGRSEVSLSKKIVTDATDPDRTDKPPLN